MSGEGRLSGELPGGEMSCGGNLWGSCNRGTECPNVQGQCENCEKIMGGGLASMSPQSFPSPSPSKIVVGNASQTRINCRGIQNT